MTTTGAFVIVTSAVSTMAAVHEMAREHQDPDQDEEPVVQEKRAHAPLPRPPSRKARPPPGGRIHPSSGPTQTDGQVDGLQEERARGWVESADRGGVDELSGGRRHSPDRSKRQERDGEGEQRESVTEIQQRDVPGRVEFVAIEQAEADPDGQNDQSESRHSSGPSSDEPRSHDSPHEQRMHSLCHGLSATATMRIDIPFRLSASGTDIGREAVDEANQPHCVASVPRWQCGLQRLITRDEAVTRYPYLTGREEASVPGALRRSLHRVFDRYANRDGGGIRG